MVLRVLKEYKAHFAAIPGGYRPFQFQTYGGSKRCQGKIEPGFRRIPVDSPSAARAASDNLLSAFTDHMRRSMLEEEKEENEDTESSLQQEQH